jgi:hypothetical protein
MNTHEKFIRESNQFDNYVEWLEAQIEDAPEEEPELLHGIFYRVFDRKHYDTIIQYDNTELSYQTQIVFPRILNLDEKEQVENIINYWSHIPYVSVEGNYGMEWKTENSRNAITIEIDFTKSASDDYGAREILEKLAEWVWKGTPVRTDNSQKYESVIKPLMVRADCP